MSQYFDNVAQQLHSRIQQAKVFITRHNATTGALAEAVLREFLQDHLPRGVSVEEGFIIDAEGGLSKQCDIIIYDSHHYAPFYRAGQVVVVPAEAVIAVIEVKTSINKTRFNEVIRYFASFAQFQASFKTYLFMYKSPALKHLNQWFHSYPHQGDQEAFDHDTFQSLPTEIIGLTQSYRLQRDYVVTDRDYMGYTSWFYKDEKGVSIGALELFFLSIYRVVEDRLQSHSSSEIPRRFRYHSERETAKVAAIALFEM